MRYKIKSVKHTGTKYNRGVDRVDRDYPSMIGKEIEIDFNHLHKGFSWTIEFCDFGCNSVETSTVFGIQETFMALVVETKNTIYELEKVL